MGVPKLLKIRKRVLVVPWSIDPMKQCSAFPLSCEGTCLGSIAISGTYFGSSICEVAMLMVLVDRYLIRY